jgi:hypothetical protein
MDQALPLRQQHPHYPSRRHRQKSVSVKVSLNEEQGLSTCRKRKERPRLILVLSIVVMPQKKHSLCQKAQHQHPTLPSRNERVVPQFPYNHLRQHLGKFEIRRLPRGPGRLVNQSSIKLIPWIWVRASISQWSRFSRLLRKRCHLRDRLE